METIEPNASYDDDVRAMTTSMDFAVVLGPSVYTPLAPLPLVYPSPRHSIATLTLVPALLLLLLVGGLSKLSINYRRDIKATWPERLEWFAGT